MKDMKKSMDTSSLILDKLARIEKKLDILTGTSGSGTVQEQIAELKLRGINPADELRRRAREANRQESGRGKR